MKDILVVYLLSNSDRSYTKSNASSIYFEQIVVCRVNIKSIFSRLGEIKRPILYINLKKYHPVKDLKMGLPAKIVNNFKWKTIFAKRSI